MDLHIHTPGSGDYVDTDSSYLDILKKAEAEGLAIIAFTDHNTVAGYAAMMQEISDLARWEESGRLKPEEKNRLTEYRRLLDKILVLPGFELTATFGFHVLAIFSPDTSIRALEHTLLELHVPVTSLEKGETEVGATVDVITAYRVMDEAGALVIGAHANSTNGVAMMRMGFGGQTRISYTQDPHLHALEVTDLESRSRRTTASFFNGSKPEYPRRMHCIQGSDSHMIRGKGKNLGVGERATEVLLPEITFEALKNVFLGTDFTRTRPYLRTASAPFDHIAAARKQGPSIVQSFHEGMTRRGGRMHAILRDVVAFANTNGGTIYIGVSPNRRVAPKGIENVDAATSELKSEVARLVSPALDVQVSVLQSDGNDILRMVVPKGNEPPYVLEGSNIYLRQEAETSLAIRDEIVALIARALGVSPRGAQAKAGEQAKQESGGQSSRQSPRQTSRQKPAPERQPAQRQTLAPQSDVESKPEQRREPAPKAEPAGRAPASDAPARAAAVTTTDAATADATEATPRGDAPHTGVEIVASEMRTGVLHHTMRDLRDGGEVHNVTRSSARRLWRYAIALKEKGTFDADKVTWKGARGLWHKYLRAGRNHYDLVEKLGDGQTRIYYGVTEEGIHGPWREVVGIK